MQTEGAVEPREMNGKFHVELRDRQRSSVGEGRVSEPVAVGQIATASSSRFCEPLEESGTHRTRLFQSPLGLVENLRCHGPRTRTSPEGFSPEFQVCLPYRGLFVWHVAGEEVVSDPNQVLFVSGGQTYRLSEPLPGGYAELIVTPSLALLAELLEIAAARVRSHALFRGRSRRADLRLQLLRARFLHRASAGTWDPLAAEELVVAILRCALRADAPAREPSGSTRRLIRRTKEFVETNLSEPFRLSDVARAVGASPAYLTHVFRRFEGLPLHKYALQSRLSRALVELPLADDLTVLALDLGFSSHSHFAVAFRRAFGSTPSEFRASTRGRRQRRIA
jgi:AraC family transcriptional regulator